MIIDCISDLHGHYPELEGGDLLIVAGDLTGAHTWQEYDKFYDWINCQNYKKKIAIAGNHDNMWKEATFGSKEDKYTQFEYLCDSGTEFEGLKIWGSPWTKAFKGMNPYCKAFTLDTEEELGVKFSLIPDDTDILITHSPPYGINDYIGEYDGHVGSQSLIGKIWRMTTPKLHVFGHIHEGYGVTSGTFVNASHVNEHYEAVNKPIRIEL